MKGRNSAGVVRQGIYVEPVLVSWFLFFELGQCCKTLTIQGGLQWWVISCNNLYLLPDVILITRLRATLLLDWTR